MHIMLIFWELGLWEVSEKYFFPLLEIAFQSLLRELADLEKKIN